MTGLKMIRTMKCMPLIKLLNCTVLFLLLLLLLTACTGKDKTITFSAEIEKISEKSILVKTIDYKDFDKASVDLREAKYDFDLAEGQIVEVTILPEIRESAPVQVTGVKLTLKKEAERRIADYFPIRNNVKYVYEGKGNEFAGYDVYVDYTSENKIQQRIDNGGTVLVRVYEIKDGKLTRTLSKGEAYYRENLLQQKDDSEEILLMEPLEKGTNWTLKNGSQRTITGVSTEVTTPMGTFPSIEVITEGTDGTTIDYYAKDIGLVKTIFQSSGMEISSTLKSVEEDAARTQTIRLYYPDIQDGRIYYQEKNVTYRTNDSTGKILEDAYKGAVNEALGVVLSTDTAIKSLSLDEENRVRLDLSASFTSDMNAGAAYEAMILQCIADTIGNYYNSGEVILTVEGKPYESGHIKMEEGQSIPVKLEGITEKS